MRWKPPDIAPRIPFAAPTWGRKERGAGSRFPSSLGSAYASRGPWHLPPADDQVLGVGRHNPHQGWGWPHGAGVPAAIHNVPAGGLVAGAPWGPVGAATPIMMSPIAVLHPRGRPGAGHGGGRRQDGHRQCPGLAAERHSGPPLPPGCPGEAVRRIRRVAPPQSYLLPPGMLFRHSWLVHCYGLLCYCTALATIPPPPCTLGLVGKFSGIFSRKKIKHKFLEKYKSR